MARRIHSPLADILKKRMNFIEKIGAFLFGKTIKVNDPFFGVMIDADTHYECRRFFGPTNKVVEIGLEKKGIESDQNQRDFFGWIEENFDLIVENISPLVEAEIVESISDFRIRNFNTEFILEYLYIPKCEVDIFEWEIVFYADNELQHSCTIDMYGLEGYKVLIDG